MRNFTLKKANFILLSITSIYGISFSINSFAQDNNNILTKPDRLLEIGEEQIDSNEDNIAEQIVNKSRKIFTDAHVSYFLRKECQDETSDDIYCDKNYEDYM